MYFSAALLKKYNNFLLDLYRCREMSSFADRVMRGLREVIPYENAAFFSVDPLTGHFFSPSHIDIEDSVFTLYENHFQQHDIYRDAVLCSCPVPSVDRCSDYMRFSEWERNEHRADFLLQNNMYYLAGVQLFQGDATIGDISVHRTGSQGDFSDEEMQMLSFLAEHIQAAFSTLKNTERQQEILTLLHDAETGVCVFDRQCRCLFANGSAELHFMRCGKLHTKLREICTKVLQFPVAQASYNGTFYLSGAMFRFQFLTVADRNYDDNFIICFDTADLREPAPERSQSFKLSEREREILGLVVKGYTNRQIGDKLYISSETVKTHIKRIFAKTGVISRTELAAKAKELIHER